MTTEEAISAANAWVDHARPVIKAWLAMEDISLGGAWLDADSAQRRAKRDGDKPAATEAFMRLQSYDEAGRHLATCRKELFGMLDGIRDNYRCDYARSASMDADEAEWDSVEEFNDELDRGIVSVDAAARMVEGE
jgi:hypothetical protein